MNVAEASTALKTESRQANSHRLLTDLELASEIGHMLIVYLPRAETYGPLPKEPRRHQQRCRKLVRLYFHRIDTGAPTAAPRSHLPPFIDMHTFHVLAALKLMAETEVANLVCDGEPLPDEGFSLTNANGGGVAFAHKQARNVFAEFVIDNAETQRARDHVYVNRRRVDV
jgi:hypothetical protein